MNETNLALHFTSNFFNSICLPASCLMKTVLFVASCICACHVDTWSVYYIYIYWCLSQSYYFKECRVRKLSLVRANNLHKVYCPLFCQTPSLKSANCPSPPFRQSPPPIYCFFVTLPTPLKMDFPVNLQNTKIFYLQPHPIL